MKHCCRNCHFLLKVSAAYSDISWDQEDRDECWPRYNRTNDPNKAKQYNLYNIYKVGCYKSIWSEAYDECGNGASKQSLKKEILRNRAEQCFFVEYHAGMPYPIAEELFKVKYDTRHLKKSYQMTWWGLIIAGFGLLVNAGFQAANFFFK